MQNAAMQRDAKTFSSYNDFPILRENLKAELNAMMLAEMNKDQTLKNNPYSGLALTLGPSLVNNMIDGLITPAGIESLFKSQQNSSSAQSKSSAANAPVQTFSPDFVNESKGEVSRSYTSIKEFEVSYRPRTGGQSKLIFERRGIWQWKLVNVKWD